MSGIVKIESHRVDALGRLPSQYADRPKMRALITGARYQGLENVLFDILENGSLAKASGASLDQLGDIVGQKRAGMIDKKYKIRILAKIGQNISNGTPEDLISIFKTLMQAERVYYQPLYPAALSLTAIGGDPVGTIDEIREAMELSHIGGVSVDYFLQVEANSFSFSDDPDPSGRGFGDLNDTNVGGTLATFL